MELVLALVVAVGLSAVAAVTPAVITLLEQRGRVREFQRTFGFHPKVLRGPKRIDFEDRIRQHLWDSGRMVAELALWQEEGDRSDLPNWRREIRRSLISTQKATWQQVYDVAVHHGAIPTRTHWSQTHPDYKPRRPRGVTMG